MKPLLFRVGFFVPAILFVVTTTQTATGQEINQGDSPAVLKAVAPQFSPLVASVMKNGKVNIDLTVNTMGEVVSARIADADLLKTLESSEVYIDPILNVAKRWLFVSSKDGQRIRQVRITFLYTTVPADTPVEELGPVFFPPNTVEVKSSKKWVGPPWIINSQE